MAIQTILIEVRVEFEDETKYEHMEAMARASAREMLTAAMLLHDKREAKVMLQTGNMFESNKELLIAEPEDEVGNDDPKLP